MCGIVGYSGYTDATPIQEMNRVQHHRGPDEEGQVYHNDGQVHLAMKRLSIIDLMSGQQPMYNIDKSLCIVFNGEIFNAPILRKQLESEGFEFKTKTSDTEVILCLYQKLGEECVSLLNGMFAFVIHDRKRNILFGAKDHFGNKPLYYHQTGNIFSFASELKSLRVLPWINCTINPNAIHHYLTTQTIPSPLTIFKDCYKLPAAHKFKYDLIKHQLNIERFWKPSFSTKTDHLGSGVLNAEIKAQFLSAVNRWMMSDVEVASSLSGGLDSSLITAAAVLNGGKLTTFTLGFPDMPELDERHLSRLVSQKYNTKSIEVLITEKDLAQDIPLMIQSLDEPYAGGLPSWFIYKAAQKAGFKVILTGSGGDELFGNYGKWIKYQNATLYCKKLYSAWRYRKDKLRLILKYPFGAIYYPYYNEQEKHNLYSKDFSSTINTNTAQFIEEIGNECYNNDIIDKIAYADINIQLPDEFLYMTDRFSMAHSIEARTPFLDLEFIKLIYSIPSSIRTKPSNLKYLLKQSLGDLLPDDLLNAPKKGFVLPMANWMKTSLREQTEYLLGKEYLKQQGIFNPDIFDKKVRPFLEEKNHNEWQIWTLLMFQMWYNNHIYLKK
jgi:asparagine synthase (glutamine-hydrolysing)